MEFKRLVPVIGIRTKHYLLGVSVMCNPIRNELGYRKLWICVLLGSIGLVAAGCSGTNKGDTASKDDALSVLRSCLEAWQKGQKPESLREQNPPITVSDQAWATGAKLEKFEIEESKSQKAGYDVKFPVKLWLDNGKTNPQQVAFTVSTAPALVVVRNFGG